MLCVKFYAIKKKKKKLTMAELSQKETSELNFSFRFENISIHKNSQNELTFWPGTNVRFSNLVPD